MKPKSTLTSKNHEETPLVFNLNAISKSYLGVQSHHLKGLDIDKYLFVLSLIVKDKTVTQQCLANCLSMDKAGMVRIIDYLTDNGYVKREVNPDDRREHRIVPTAKAVRLYPRLLTAFKTTNDEAFKGFSKQDKEQFYCMMERVFQNLSGLPADQYFVRYIKAVKKK